MSGPASELDPVAGFDPERHNRLAQSDDQKCADECVSRRNRCERRPVERE